MKYLCDNLTIFYQQDKESATGGAFEPQTASAMNNSETEFSWERIWAKRA